MHAVETMEGTDVATTPKPSACPACLGDIRQRLETIDVRDQHHRYSEDPQVRLLLDEAAERSGLEYHVCRCDACGLEYADPMRAPSAEWYALAYRARELFCDERWEFGAVLSSIPSGSRLLEFGCGTGGFLKLCRARQIGAIGVDFSSDAIAECRKEGLDGRQIDVCQPALRADEPLPDHIAAFHVLEHLDHPVALFEQGAAVAAPATKFWVAVPSHRRATRWLGEQDYLDQPPHHMTRWTDAALRAVARRAGWNLESVIYEPMPMKNAVWTLATRSALYQVLHRRGCIPWKTLRERAVRLALYPAAALKRLGPGRNITGFTMLARFGRA